MGWSAGLAAWVLLGWIGCAPPNPSTLQRDASPAGGGVVILWQVDPDDARHVVVEVNGLGRAVRGGASGTFVQPADWVGLLSVHVQDASGGPRQPAMLGEYEVRGDALHFTPAFRLERGTTYMAMVPGTEILEGRVSRHTVPALEMKPEAVVEHIYPSTDLLPENLLKFYLHFSAPMSRGHVYDHIDLLNEDGHEIVLPFLEIEEELWDRELTRLTLLFDPGRIKREVKPLEDVGPALEAGRAYTLVIHGDGKDARGVPLVSGAKKSFRAVDPDREGPDPGRWRVAAPAAGTRDALVVTFREPMDHALALRLIAVKDADGEWVRGMAGLDPEERAWQFVPDREWAAGTMSLVVDTVLEDLAGNSVGKPFEVDLLEKGSREVLPKAVSILFEIE